MVRRWIQRLFYIVVILAAGRVFAQHVWAIYHRKAHIWLPGYIAHRNPDVAVPGAEKHLIFVMVDHYEPGKVSAESNSTASGSARSGESLSVAGMTMGTDSVTRGSTPTTSTMSEC